MAIDPKRKVAAIFLPLLFGLMALFNFISSPRFEAYRAVDVVRLVGCGMCFGVALVGIVIALRGSRVS